jgi:hypothetical protein
MAEELDDTREIPRSHIIVILAIAAWALVFLVIWALTLIF